VNNDSGKTKDETKTDAPNKETKPTTLTPIDSNFSLNSSEEPPVVETSSKRITDFGIFPFVQYLLAGSPWVFSFTLIENILS
jgi:hypothetical protein